MDSIKLDAELQLVFHADGELEKMAHGVKRNR